MTMTLKKVLLVLVGGPVVLFVALVAIGLAVGPDRIHERAEAIRTAEKAKEPVAVEAPAAATKNSAVKGRAAAKPSVAAEKAAESCQVETEDEALREVGQKLCVKGIFTKVEVTVDDSEMYVLSHFSPEGWQLFRAQESKFFDAGRTFVDRAYDTTRLNFYSYQLFSPTSDITVGTCWRQRGQKARCKTYTGSTPKFVQ